MANLKQCTTIGAVILVFAVFRPGTMWAQGITVGGKLGINLARTAVDDFNDEQTRSGIVGGAAVGFGLSQAFSLQVEVLYAQKGVEAQDGSLLNRLETDYVEVPILARIRIPVVGSNVRPMFTLGPAISFEVACSLGAEGGGINVDVSCSQSDGMFDPIQTASVDFGLAVGAGLDIPVARTTLSFEGRYTYGLTDILKQDASQLKNRAISFVVGFGFRIR